MSDDYNAKNIAHNGPASDSPASDSPTPGSAAPDTALSDKGVPVVGAPVCSSGVEDPEFQKLAARLRQPTGMTAGVMMVSGLISVMLGSATGSASGANIGNIVGAVVGSLMVVPVAAGIYCGFLRKFRRLPGPYVTKRSLRVMVSGCVVAMCSSAALFLSYFSAHWNASLAPGSTAGDGVAFSFALLATLGAGPGGAVIALLIEQAVRQKTAAAATATTVAV